MGRSSAATAAAAGAVVDGVAAGTSPSRGHELHRFLLEHRLTRCLELGFAHGIGSVYIASALEAMGEGSLTSVDLPSALARRPTAKELLERAGLEHRVQLVIDPGGYVWWLRRKLREQLREGRIKPAYDFVFIDGAHTWAIDALAFCLVDRLLAPDGWVLFDDLDWEPSDRRFSDVPDETREVAHVNEIWELLVKTDSSYDQLLSDGKWGYAHKCTTREPFVRTVVKRDLLGQARELARMARVRVGV